MNQTTPSRHTDSSLPLVALSMVFATLVLFFEPTSATAQAAVIGGQFQISQDTACADSPDVAMNAEGRFVAVWGEDNASIQSRRYDADGTALESAQIIAAGGGESQPRVGIEADGDFVVVWQTFLGSGYQIQGQRFDSAGSSVGALLAISNTTEVNTLPQVAVDDMGNFVVVWKTSGYSSVSVEARRYSSGGTALGSQFKVNTSGVVADHPDVGIEPDGDTFLVVWQDADNEDIRGQRYDAGGAGVGVEFVANTYTTGSQGRPKVSMMPSGEFAVSWSGDHFADPDAVVVDYFEANGSPRPGLGTPLGNSNDEKSGLRVAVSNDTDSLLGAWQTFTGAPQEDDIHGAANANLDFIIPTNVTANQGSVEVAMDDRERGMAIWKSDHAATSCSSIYGQRVQLYQILSSFPFEGTVHSLTTQGAWKYFVYFPPAPSVLTVTLTNLPANSPQDADLFVRYGNFPTLSEFDCHSILAGGADETCVIASDVAPLLIGVNGWEPGSIDFQLNVSAIPALLFADGFESGNTSVWSSTVP